MRSARSLRKGEVSCMRPRKTKPMHNDTPLEWIRPMVVCAVFCALTGCEKLPVLQVPHLTENTETTKPNPIPETNQAQLVTEPTQAAQSRGAIVPWTTYEAEEARTTGSILGPSRKYLTPESEASGSKYVRLDAPGQSVEFTVTKAADAIVVRYSIPDSPGGGGTDSVLGLYVNGAFVKKLPVTSRYSWIYGDFPWSNDPEKGKAHHFFDESHALIGELSPGDVLSIRMEESDTVPYCLIDFIELEKAPAPLTAPVESLSITDFEAKGDGSGDDSPAFVRCFAAAREQGKTVWIPPGDYRLDGDRIEANGIKVHGAGMWHSRLIGKKPMFKGAGQPVEFSDLSILGEIDHRTDNSPDNAFDGNFGDGSVFRNLWIEHLKCGFWTTRGTDHMLVEGCRIRDTMADGINFCGGTSHSTVRNCHFRNTGDDAMATWSPAGGSDAVPCVENSFIHNTVELPWLANGIALYGGSDHLVASNRVMGTVYAGGGILISSGFGSIPFGGTLRVNDNTVSGTGGNCYIGETVGSLWIHAKDSDITVPVLVDGLQITDAPVNAITVNGPKNVTDLRLRNVAITGAGQHAIDIKCSGSGTVTVSGLSYSGIGSEPFCEGSSGSFPIKIDEGSLVRQTNN